MVPETLLGPGTARVDHGAVLKGALLVESLRVGLLRRSRCPASR